MGWFQLIFLVQLFAVAQFVPFSFVNKGVAPAIDANTILLIQSEYSNGSTVFSDSSPVANTVTNNGTVTHTTSTSHFGSSSIDFSGSGYLHINNASFVFATNDYTIDFWGKGDGLFFSMGFPGGGGYPSCSGIRGLAFRNEVNGVSLISALTGGVSVSVPGHDPEIWHHFALVRSSAIEKIYIDGVYVGLGYNNKNYDVTQNLYIGRNYNGNQAGTCNMKWTDGQPGELEEFRISDIARWTSNFTPPIMAYQ